MSEKIQAEEVFLDNESPIAYDIWIIPLLASFMISYPIVCAILLVFYNFRDASITLDTNFFRYCINFAFINSHNLLEKAVIRGMRDREQSLGAK